MAESDSANDSPMIVSIGEALYDCFPNRTVLGGAPVNVTVHANQLFASVRGNGTVVSRVGKDDLGQKLVDDLESRGIATNFVQLDSQLPTGTVHVQVNESGEPSYEITEGVAWDNLDFSSSLERLAASCSAVCFGTLAQRSCPSRSAIQRFLSCATDAVRLFDVNLRQHYFDEKVVRDSLNAATAIKLNQDELLQISELLLEDLGAVGNIDDKLQTLAELFELDYIALTRGSEGTVFYTQGERIEAKPISITRVSGADNVGAGDACSAGLIYGLLMNWEPAQTVELANRMGAFVASQPGATPVLPKDIMKFAEDGSTRF